MSGPEESKSTLASEAWQKIEQATASFEAAWQRGDGPRIEDYLPAEGPERRILLQELVAVDIAYRRRKGEEPKPADYLDRYTGLGPTWLAQEIVVRSPSDAPTVDIPAATQDPVSPAHTQAVRLRCPHCHNPIQLVDSRSEEILCPGCGSSFRVREARHTTTSRPMKRLGKFQLLERVGLGAFGAVWRAKDTQLDRIVALKIPHTGLLTQDEDLERFHREARAAAQLRHPNIVTVHEVQMLDGLPTLVEDFIQGVPLKDLLEARRVTFTEAATLIAEVADALHYAHEMGVIHRDLKPANIMIESVGHAANAHADEQGRRTLDSSSRRPLIMDFGLALRDEAEVTMTLDGHIIGTPAYMSPEQAAGKAHQVDRRSDVYTLGVILYELLTGELPFRGSRLMMLDQVLYEEPRAPRKVNDKIPRDLETICLKAMSKAPSRRYASARELADDLRRFLNGLPIVARPVGLVGRSVRWCRRNPTLATAIGVAALALLAGSIASGLFAVKQNWMATRLADTAAGLEETTKRLQTSLQDATTERHRADERAKVAQLRLAGNYLERGLAFCEQGEEARGILWLARSLKEAPEEEPALQRTIRANLAAWESQTHPLRAALKHTGWIEVAEFSPDSKKVLTWSSIDNAAWLWDADVGKPIAPSLQHLGTLTAAAFSPDGKIVATASTDGIARLWQSDTGLPVGSPLQHHAVPLRAIAFSPDGKMVLTESMDRKVWLWDAATGKPMGPPSQHQDWLIDLALRPFPNVNGQANGFIAARLWQLEEQKRMDLPLQIPRKEGFPKQNEAPFVFFSPNGKAIVTADREGTASMWDTRTGMHRSSLFQHQGRITAVAFSPDGKTILTGSEDKTARLWEAETGNPIGLPLQHEDSVAQVALGPDSETATTITRGKTVRLWQVMTGRLIGVPLQQQEPVSAMRFSPDGKTLMTCVGKETRLWDAGTGYAVGHSLKHQAPVLAVAFSPDGVTVLTGSADRTAQLWEVETSSPAGPPLQHQGAVRVVAFSRDGKKILTGSTDNTAQIWDAGSKKRAGPALEHRGPVCAACFSPEGETVLTGSTYNAAQLWEAKTGTPIGGPLEHQGSVRAVAFSPDGKQALTGGLDGAARLWDVKTARPINPYLTHQGFVNALAFSPDGKMVLTGSADKTAQLWDAATHKPIGPPLRHQDWVRAVAFSGNSKIVVTGSDDKTARLWETETSKLLSPPLQHRGTVWVAAFSPDGTTVLTGSADNTARLWDARTGKPIGPPLHHRRAVQAAAFRPDSKMVVTGSEDNTARLWDVPPMVKGTADLILLRLSVLTGMELDGAGDFHVLDGEDWQKRRHQLAELGGPPVP